MPSFLNTIGVRTEPRHFCIVGEHEITRPSGREYIWRHFSTLLVVACPLSIIKFSSITFELYEMSPGSIYLSTNLYHEVLNVDYFSILLNMKICIIRWLCPYWERVFSRARSFLFILMNSWVSHSKCCFYFFNLELQEQPGLWSCFYYLLPRC